MPLEFVDLKREHFLKLYPRMRGDIKDVPFDQLMASTMIMASYGNAYAAVDQELVVAIGGLMNSRAGMGQLWIMGSDDIRRYARSFTKLIRELRDPLMEELNMHRIQAEVLVEEPTWIRWAHLFGMKEEGIMRQFTEDRKDCILMSYVLDKVETG
jgi:hypothetical protein